MRTYQELMAGARACEGAAIRAAEKGDAHGFAALWKEKAAMLKASAREHAAFDEARRFVADWPCGIAR